MKRYTPALILAILGVGSVMVAQTPQQLEQARQRVLAIEQREQQQQVLSEQQEQDIAELKALLAVTPPGGGEVEFGACGEPMNAWHGDVVMVNGQECYAGHEHGDAPPAWLTAHGVNVVFGGPEATPNENLLKHVAYKGFVAIDDRFGQDLDPGTHPDDPNPNDNQKIYVRVHAAANPHDEMARFHSYQLFVEDSAGELTIRQGWYDAGSGVFPGLQRPSSADETSIRPIISVVDQKGWEAQRRCSQWYMVGSRVVIDPVKEVEYGEGWGPDMGWNICGSPYIAQPGQHLTGHNPETWVPAPETNFGAQRTFDVSLDPTRGDPPIGVFFYANQFGGRVSGPMDAACGAPIEFGGVTYTQLCLPQYTSKALQAIGFSSGNTWQKVFSTRNVRLPN